MRQPARAGRGLTHVVVDTPRGSRNKFKFDEARQLFKLSRTLPDGMHFPYDFGSIPGTLGDDGDALDVVVLIDAPTFVGCLLTVRLIGVITALQTEARHKIRNDRLVAVPVTPVNVPRLRRLADLSAPALAELEYFFIHYNRVEGRIFTPLTRQGARAAERLLDDAIQRYTRSGADEPA